ncbi:MAG: hypothetical protein GF330_03540, partial [Candidatus Eisenbacteria bacterium]|nr:hypothetical protein [Candidatus Eisenbacteria bacterium]
MCRMVLVRTGIVPIHRIGSGFLLLLLLAAPFAAGVLSLDSGSASAPDAGDASSAPFWVFFRDRGPALTRAERAEETLSLARAISPEVWARRARGRGAILPDRHDRPLWRPYVDAVAAHGRLRHESRWLNAISIRLTREGVRRVVALPCVREVRPVAHLRLQSIGPARDAAGNPLGLVAHPRRIPEPPAYTAPRGGPHRASQERLGAAASHERTLLYGLSLWQLEEITVPPVHALGYSGNRVGFMMIDTGFRTDHDCFAEVDVIAEHDFIFDDDITMNEPEDDPYAHAHGTHTWG